MVGNTAKHGCDLHLKQKQNQNRPNKTHRSKFFVIHIYLHVSYTLHLLQKWKNKKASKF